jgi:hypothetical protein
MARLVSRLPPNRLAIGGLIAGLALGLAIGFGALQPSKSNVEAQMLARENYVEELTEILTSKDSRIQELLTIRGAAQEELTKAKVTLGQNTTQIVDTHATVQKLQRDLSQTQSRAAKQAEEIAPLKASIDSLLAFKKTVEILQEAVGPLGTDRLLLVELRKEAPDDQAAATEFYENIKKLAVQSDPSLGPKADRILRLLPTYFDYLESSSEATSCEGVFSAYSTSGVTDYFTVESDFKKDMLLVLINRIDALLTTVN